METILVKRVELSWHLLQNERFISFDNIWWAPNFPVTTSVSVQKKDTTHA